KIGQRAHVICELSHIIREPWHPKKQLKTATARYTWLSSVIREAWRQRSYLRQRPHVIREAWTLYVSQDFHFQ
ncbi:hypothetical protein PIB30_094419, partial [Stylosanthes scabra]|nr:hypothetical protein [Stylosanthes scabra]